MNVFDSGRGVVNLDVWQRFVRMRPYERSPGGRRIGSATAALKKILSARQHRANKTRRTMQSDRLRTSKLANDPDVILKILTYTCQFVNYFNAMPAQFRAGAYSAAQQYLRRIQRPRAQNNFFIRLKRLTLSLN